LYVQGEKDLRYNSILVALLSLAASASVEAQFDKAVISGYVVASARIDVIALGGTLEQAGGGPVANFYGGLAVGYGPQVGFETASAAANASQNTSFTPTSITSNGSVGSDTDDSDKHLSGGEASGESTLTVTFNIDLPTAWTFDDLSINGTHAGGSVSLYPASAPDQPVFFFGSSGPYYKGESGTPNPGTYTFTATIGAYTNVNDGFGGLFADASYSLAFRLTPPVACPGDTSGDGAVTFFDITTVLANFGNAYSPGTGPGDADGSGVVAFFDITTVLANFGNTCP
jgi:hypothetical protein